MVVNTTTEIPSDRFSVVVYYNSIEGGTMSSHETRENTPEDNTASESDPTRAFTRHKAGEALAKAGFGDVLVLSHEQADQVLTPARRAVIDTLATQEVSSLRDLANHLDRNPGNLSRDMQVLVAENIIRYEENGKAKRPELKHDTIITEPLVATEDPVPESISSA